MRLLEQQKSIKECRQCLHFEESCPFFKDVNYMDPVTANCCRYFTNINNQELIINDTLFNNELTFSITGNDYIHHQYPEAPDYFVWLQNKEIYWYKGKDEFSGKEFGCWILNHSKRLLPVVKSRTEAVMGWTKNVYKSPVPLHDHKASNSLLSSVCWYISKDGFGQFGVLVGNGLGYLTNPRPKTWRQRMN